MKNVFLFNERGCRDIKTEKALEQDWDVPYQQY